MNAKILRLVSSCTLGPIQGDHFEEPHSNDIILLRYPFYRQHGLPAVAAGKGFRRLFDGFFCYHFGWKHERTHENLAMLLIRNGVVKGPSEAEEFISDILGADIYMSQHGRESFRLQKDPYKDTYYLEHCPE